ncbi:MAG: hypothetical protein ISR44_00955 [Rhodospirillales bacterium]|nr:hypothetical protein [Rhodospirillales bacterium]
MAEKENKRWWHFQWLSGNIVRASVRMIMGVFAIVLFSLATKLIFGGNVDNAPLAGVAIAGGGFCLIFFFLTQFKKFKGFGIEAESWEREMEDAKRITNNMRNLAQLVVEPSMMLVMRTGRWASGISRREANDLVDRFEELLVATETPSEDAELARAEYYRYTLFDMVRGVGQPLTKCLETKVNLYHERLKQLGSPVTDLEGHNAASKEWNDARSRADIVKEALSLENISERGFDGVIEATQKCELLSEDEINELLDEHKEEVADIRFFEEHKKLRRPEVWFAGDDN